MPTLAEIMASPESLNRAASEFASFHLSQTKSANSMNQGISSDEDFIAMMNACGNKDSAHYKMLCEIGQDD